MFKNSFPVCLTSQVYCQRENEENGPAFQVAMYFIGQAFWVCIWCSEMPT